jgi:uncharacterized protein
MAKDLGIAVTAFIGKEDLLKTVEAKKYVTEQIGELTIRDILNELKKPGLDPRSEAQVFEFANIYSIDDVKVGMEVPGVVTNITRFGAFIDIGVKQDGLVHVSEISHTYITDPNEVLKLNQHVNVKVLEVDTLRKRIALSIKQTLEAPAKKQGGNRGFQAPRNGGQTSQPAKKPIAELPMNDALAALKQKFGR